jgi:flagellin
MQINATSFSLNSVYQGHRKGLESSMLRLSTGDRFASTGDGNAGDLSMSQRFRNRVRSAEASSSSLQTATAFLDTTEAYAQTTTDLLQRMIELASTSSQGLLSSSDRAGLETEFQVIKSELTDMTRNSLFFGKQTIGRNVMVSYDDNDDRIKFWQTTGEDPGEIERDFGTGAIDSQGNTIGFSVTEDYTMSNDGRSLYYLSNVAGDPVGTTRIKRYDIENNLVYTGGQTFATGDSLFSDEQGDMYVNGAGTLYSVNTSSLDRTATLVTDMRAGGEFSVSDGAAIYSRSADNAIASTVIGTGTQTALTGALAFATAVDHDVSSAGNYVTEEVAPGQIRVIDTRSGNEATINIGAGTAVNNLQFNRDGDRVYYVNDDTAAIHYIDVDTESDGSVTLGTGAKVVQGVNSSSLNGLSLGGSNYNSSIKYVLSEDTATQMSYDAIDLSLYNLGLVNSHIDTYQDANNAIDELQTAMNRVSAERAITGAMASRLRFTISSHSNYIANLSSIESEIRDVDIAKEASIMSAQEVKQSAAAAILAQFNTLSRNILALLN